MVLYGEEPPSPKIPQVKKIMKVVKPSSSSASMCPRASRKSSSSGQKPKSRSADLGHSGPCESRVDLSSSPATSKSQRPCRKEKIPYALPQTPGRNLDQNQHHRHHTRAPAVLYVSSEEDPASLEDFPYLPTTPDKWFRKLEF